MAKEQYTFSRSRYRSEPDVIEIQEDEFTDRVSFAEFSCFSFVMGFASPRTMIGLENSRHPLNQSNAKLAPIASWSQVFPRFRLVTGSYIEFS